MWSQLGLVESCPAFLDLARKALDVIPSGGVDSFEISETLGDYS